MDRQMNKQTDGQIFVIVESFLRLKNRQLVIGQTKVSFLFLDRVEFLDRLECLDRQVLIRLS